MPHKLKKNIENISHEVKDLGPEGEGNWEELLLKHSLYLIISTLTFQFPSTRIFNTNLPIGVDTALKGEASSGNIHLVPYCPLALTHPEKED